MSNLDPILQMLLDDLLQLGQIFLAFTFVGVIPALALAIGAGAANEQQSRWRDVPSGAFWGLFAGVPTWVATFVVLLGLRQLAGVLTNPDFFGILLVLSSVPGLFAAYRTSAWYFQRKAQQLWGWAIEDSLLSTQPANRWYSFSLQRLIVAQFILLLVIGLWISVRRDKIQRVAEMRREMAAWQVFDESAKSRFGGWSRNATVSFSQRPILYELRFDETLADFDDKVLERLQPSDRLRRIIIRSNSLTDAGMEILGRQEELEYLEIHSDAVTDAGIAHLTNLQQLKNLQVTCPKLTAKSLDDLQTMESLKDVAFYKSSIPWQRANEFEKARPGVSVFVLP